MDQVISEKKLYRLTGVLSVKVYDRAKRMDVNFTPYWKLLLRKPKAFVHAKLLDHSEEEINGSNPMV